MPHIVYWARLSFGREILTQLLRDEDGIALSIVQTLQECMQAVRDADGLILYNCRAADARQLAEAIAAHAPKLRWMHFLTAGMDGFDGLELPPRIAITQTGGASAPVVAEHAMALLLALGRGLPAAWQQQARGLWDRGCAQGLDSLEQKTMAIIGLGFIGQEVARRARAFGMRIVAVSRQGLPHALADESHSLRTLETALARSDVVVLTVALNPQTRHLLDARTLALCKRGATVINVSRGAIIDTEALCAALASGQIGAAGLDVTDPEPLPEGHPLWRMPQVLVTPHVAVEGSRPTERRIAEGAIAALHSFLGHAPAATGAL